MASLVVGVGGLGYWLVMKFQVELYGFGLSPILWSTGCNTNMMCQFCLCPIQCFSLTWIIFHCLSINSKFDKSQFDKPRFDKSRLWPDVQSNLSPPNSFCGSWKWDEQT